MLRNGKLSIRSLRRSAAPGRRFAVGCGVLSGMQAYGLGRRARSCRGSRSLNGRFASFVRPMRSCARVRAVARHRFEGWPERLFCDGGARPPTGAMIAFVDAHRDAYGVEPICRVLPIAPSTWHEHAARRADPSRLPARAKRDEALKE